LETKAIVVPGDTHKIKRLKTQPRITSWMASDLALQEMLQFCIDQY
jgi:hypothetical protein